MGNTITINGNDYQRQHITPQVAMGVSGSATSPLRNQVLIDLVNRGLWDPDSASINLIALPADAQYAQQIGVTRHFNTSHTGYTRWYNDQVNLLAASATSDADLVNKLIGFNNFLKSEYVDPNSPLMLHGNQQNAYEALTNHPDFQMSEYTQTPEFRLGAELGDPIPVRVDAGTPIDPSSPYDTANGVSAANRDIDLHDQQVAMRNNIDAIAASVDVRDGTAYIGNIELTPGLITKIAVGAELLRHAGVAGDIIEIAATFSRAQEIIANGGDLSDVERLFAGLGGNLVGGAAGAWAGAALMGAVLAGTGVGTLPGLALMLAAGLVGGIAGSVAGEAVANSLYGYLEELNDGEPFVIDDFIEVYHNALKEEDVYAEVMLGQALMGVGNSHTGMASKAEIEAALIEAVRMNRDLLDDIDALGQAVIAVVGDKNHLLSFADQRDIFRSILDHTNGLCFTGDTIIEMWDGSRKEISEIVPGDVVRSFDNDGVLVPGEVVRLFRGQTDDWIELTYDVDGVQRQLTATPGHPFMTPEGTFSPLLSLVNAQGVAEIVLADGSVAYARARHLSYSAQTSHLFEAAQGVAVGVDGAMALAPKAAQGWATYNFEVARTHTYIAGDVRVHNRCLENFVTEATLNALVEAGIVDRADAVYSEATGQYIVLTPEGEVATEGDLAGQPLVKIIEVFADVAAHVQHSIGQVFEDVGIYIGNALPGLFADLINGKDFEQAVEDYAKSVIASMGVDILANIFGLQALPRDIHGNPVAPNTNDPLFFDTEIGAAIKGALVTAATMRLITGEALTGDDYARLATNASVKLVVTKALQTQSWAVLPGEVVNQHVWDGLFDPAGTGPQLSLGAQTAAAAAVSLLIDLFDGGIEDPVAALGNAAIAAATTYLSGIIVGTWTTTASGAAVLSGGLLSEALMGLGAAAGPVGMIIGAVIGALLGKLFGGLFSPPPPLVTITRNDDGTITVNVTDKSGGYIYLGRNGYDDEIVGHNGHDALVGGSGDNAIHGLNGNDRLEGRGGDDLLTGGNGNDEILAGSGNDDAMGGRGHDLIDGGSGNDFILGGDGNDTIFGDSRSDEREADFTARGGVQNLGNEGDSGQSSGGSGGNERGGTAGSDGTHNDILLGGAGNDEIYAGRGDDYVSGSFGDDLLMGQSGDDVITGGAHNDSIRGDAGDDVIDGDAGSDKIDGGSGDDVLHGDKMVVLYDTVVTTAIESWFQARVRTSEALKTALGLNAAYAAVTAMGARPFGGAFTLEEVLTTKVSAVESALIDGLEGTTSDVFESFRDWLKGSNLQLWRKINRGDFDYLASDYAPVADDPDTEVDEAAGNPLTKVVTLGGGYDTITGGSGDDTAYGGHGHDSLHGGSGDDVLYGDALGQVTLDDGSKVIGLVGAGNDTLRGAEGNDVLNGGDGANLLDGGDGDDQITAGSGKDTIYGGKGADLISSGAGDDLIYAGDSGVPDTGAGETEQDLHLQDVVNAGAGNDTVYGEDGSDYLNGAEGNDSVVGGNGADNVIGEDGNDTLKGDAGGDVVDGGAGDDWMHGGADDDAVLGGSGNDTMYGGTGNDIMQGWTGADLMRGEAGNDTMLGEIGADTMSGGDGDDSMAGGSDNDTVNGDAGNDTLYGGSGNDRVDGGTGNDSAEGGDGNDIMTGHDGLDTLDGGTGADKLYGGNDADVLRGGDGVDTLYGQNGNDTLKGDAGNDVLSGASGNDLVEGGTGNDKGYGGSGNDTLKGQEGNDSLYGQDGHDRLEGGAGNDDMDGGNHNDRMWGGDGADTIRGGAGNDMLSGGNGNDVLHSGGGSDTLHGGNGGDTLIAGRGYQSLNGGAGNDLYKISLAGLNGRITDTSGADKIEFAAPYEPKDLLMEKSGDHLIIRSRANPADKVVIVDQFKGAPVIEAISFAAHSYTLDLTNVILGSNGNDTLTGTENDDYILALAGDDLVVGAGGDDFLDGGPGKDVLFGNAGNDSVYGSSEDDLLNGGTGNDFLDDGLGDDYMIGAEGRDTFGVTENAGDADIIADFVRGTDMLDLKSFGDQFVSLKQMKYFGTQFAMDGADAVLTFDGGQTLTIENLHFNLLRESDIDFDVTSVSGTVGTASNDIITGTGASEVINGGRGFDIMSGGAGADRFVIGDHAGDIDTIRDFNVTQDTLDLRAFSDHTSIHQFAVAQRGADVTISFGDDQHLILENVQKSQLSDANVIFDTFTDQTGATRYSGQIDHNFATDNVVERETRIFSDDPIAASGGLARDISALAGTDGYVGAAGFSSGTSEGSYGTGVIASNVIDTDAGVQTGFSYTLKNNSYYKGTCKKKLVKPGTFSGTNADDLMYANYWSEKIYAHNGDDRVYAGGGNDKVWAGNGDDEIYGQDGNDVLYGEAGDDYLNSGNGNDSVYGHSGDDILRGGNGHDYLNGGSGRDSVLGDAGNDRIYGEGGGDKLYGGSGHDSVYGQDGNDKLWGGSDNDKLYGGAGHDYLNGQSGNDYLKGDSGNDYLIGEDGHDTLYGGSGNDDLHGGNHNDKLYGDSGNDELRGNDGEDYLSGGTGHDKLVGGHHNDTLDGDSGNDLLYGQWGNDSLLGGTGWDNLYGEDGHDTLRGEDGNDRLYGGAHNDYLHGGGNDDRLDGGSGNDTLVGGSDHGDWGIARWADNQGGKWGSQDWLSGDFNGDGKDDLMKVWTHNGKMYADVHASSGSSFGIARWANAQGGKIDSMDWMAGDYNGDGKDDLMKVWTHNGKMYADVHVSTGSGFSMQRWANAQGGKWDSMDWLTGDYNGDGKDDIVKVWTHNGKMYSDVHLSNGSGFGIQRWANAQGGKFDSMDWLSGDFNGDGRDDIMKVWTHKGTMYADVHVSTGSGFAIQRWANAQGGKTSAMDWMVADVDGDGKDDLVKVWEDGGKMYSDVHVSTGSAFKMERWADAQGGKWSEMDWLTGDFNGDGRDDMMKAWRDSNGRMDADVHLSRATKDVLIGGDGHDSLIGGTGSDDLIGGTGQDTLRGGKGNDDLDGGTWNDTLYGDSGSDLLKGGDGDDYLNGGSDDDALYGGNGSDRAYGGSGNDVINGQAGHDTVVGGSGHDKLTGEGGNDRMYGETGNDLMNGGTGHDYLEGDSGRDIIIDDSGLNFIHGGSGADFLSGGNAADRIYGGSGSDLIGGDGGDDYIDGGTNGDVIDAGAGNDKVLGGHGADEIYGGTGSDILDGGAQDDQIYGEAGKDHLIGGGGNDWLVAGDGNDSVDGGTGHDMLVGDAGADRLQGGSGNDTLVGGAGADLLTGGTGRDTFNYDALDDSTEDAIDVITDFDRALDKIDLRDFDISYADLDITEVNGNTDVAVAGTDFVVRLLGDDHDLSASQFHF